MTKSSAKASCERARKEKIVEAIMKLADIVPSDYLAAKSQINVLTGVYDYIKNLQLKLDAAISQGGESVQAKEIKRLKLQLKDVQERCRRYAAMIESFQSTKETKQSAETATVSECSTGVLDMSKSNDDSHTNTTAENHFGSDVETSSKFIDGDVNAIVGNMPAIAPLQPQVTYIPTAQPFIQPLQTITSEPSVELICWPNTLVVTSLQSLIQPTTIMADTADGQLKSRKKRKRGKSVGRSILKPILCAPLKETRTTQTELNESPPPVQLLRYEGNIEAAAMDVAIQANFPEDVNARQTSESIEDSSIVTGAHVEQVCEIVARGSPTFSGLYLQQMVDMQTVDSVTLPHSTRQLGSLDTATTTTTSTVPNCHKITPLPEISTAVLLPSLRGETDWSFTTAPASIQNRKAISQDTSSQQTLSSTDIALPSQQQPASSSSTIASRRKEFTVDFLRSIEPPPSVMQTSNSNNTHPHYAGTNTSLPKAPQVVSTTSKSKDPCDFARQFSHKTTSTSTTPSTSTLSSSDIPNNFYQWSQSVLPQVQPCISFESALPPPGPDLTLRSSTDAQNIDAVYYFSQSQPGAFNQQYRSGPAPPEVNLSNSIFDFNPSTDGNYGVFETVPFIQTAEKPRGKEEREIPKKRSSAANPHFPGFDAMTNSNNNSRTQGTAPMGTVSQLPDVGQGQNAVISSGECTHVIKRQKRPKVEPFPFAVPFFSSPGTVSSSSGRNSQVQVVVDKQNSSTIQYFGHQQPDKSFEFSCADARPGSHAQTARGGNSATKLQTNFKISSMLSDVVPHSSTGGAPSQISKYRQNPEISDSDRTNKKQQQQQLSNLESSHLPLIDSAISGGSNGCDALITSVQEPFLSTYNYNYGQHGPHGYMFPSSGATPNSSQDFSNWSQPTTYWQPTTFPYWQPFGSSAGSSESNQNS